MRTEKKHTERAERRKEKVGRASLRKRGIESIGSAEEKIKEAARRLFTNKGYDAVKTRDIAEEAGINLALLNYYFRSKEKLFEIIMIENISNFFEEVGVIVNDETTDFFRKIELLVEFYINNLSKSPDVPLFVLNVARRNPEHLPKNLNLNSSCFLRQFMEEGKAGKIEKLNPGHLMANILGLAVFPFAARPMMQRVRNMNDEEFNAMMMERKKLVPIWIKAMLEIKK